MRPEIACKPTSISSPLLSLENLDQLNNMGSKGGDDVFLTSTADITTKPQWLEGVKPNEEGRIGRGDGGGDGKTAVVIVVDKGGGVVDAFWFYFWAFNFGGLVLERELGEWR